MTEVFQVAGMGCNNCVNAVKSAVAALDPAARVEVELASGKVEVTSQQARTALAAAIAGAGYEVA